MRTTLVTRYNCFFGPPMHWACPYVGLITLIIVSVGSVPASYTARNFSKGTFLLLIWHLFVKTISQPGLRIEIRKRAQLEWIVLIFDSVVNLGICTWLGMVESPGIDMQLEIASVSWRIWGIFQREQGVVPRFCSPVAAQIAKALWLLRMLWRLQKMTNRKWNIKEALPSNVKYRSLLAGCQQSRVALPNTRSESVSQSGTMLGAMMLLNDCKRSFGMLLFV